MLDGDWKGLFEAEELKGFDTGWSKDGFSLF